MLTQAYRIINEKKIPAPIFLFEPTGKCHAQAFFFHGICEHGLRYINFAKELAENGIRVIFSDHQGHGLAHKDYQRDAERIAETFEMDSEQQTIQLSHTQRSLRFSLSEEKTLDTFAQLSMPTHLEDMKKLVEVSFEKNYFDQNIPFYIIGQSMGGLLTSALGQELSESKLKPKAAILLSPAFLPQAEPGKLGTAVEKLFLKLSWKSRQGSKILKPLFNKISQQNLKVKTSWACKHISDIETEEQVFKDDFLISEICTLNYLASIEELMFKMHNNARKYPLPIQIFYSHQDKIVNSKGSDQFLAHYKETHDQNSLEQHLYDDIPAHDLLRSSVREEIIQKIVNYTKA